MSQSAHTSAVGAMSSRVPRRRTLSAQPTYTSVRLPMLSIVLAATFDVAGRKMRAIPPSSVR